MSNSLNTAHNYMVPDESDSVRVTNEIYTGALAMQHQALSDLIKLELSSTMYNYIHNSIHIMNII